MVTCVNEDVLDARGYRIWLSMAIDEGPHSSPIVRRLYARRGYRSESEAGFGSKSVTDEVVFGASRGNSVIGTIAVRMDSPAGLRAGMRYADAVEALRHKHRKLCELDRVALDQAQDAMEILGALIRVASLYAGEVRGATDLLIEVHPQHVETYRRLLGFQRVADHNPRVLLGIPRVLLRLEIAQLAHAQAASGRADLADGGLSGGVLTPHELEEAARRIQDTIAAACAPLLTARSFEFESSAGPRVDNIRPAAPPLSASANLTQFDSKTYDEGLRAGVQARIHKQTLTAYQRVGLDEFARGCRAGFFAKSARVQMSEAGDGRAPV